MLIVGKLEAVLKLEAEIIKIWKCKPLSDVDTFVGFQIRRNRKERTIKIHQQFYTKSLVNRL